MAKRLLVFADNRIVGIAQTRADARALAAAESRKGALDVAIFEEVFRYELGPVVEKDAS